MASSETKMNKGREKEEAIANGVKMRALQAGLMQKSSPSSTYNSIRIPSSSSPASRPLPNLSAHDYPVFTPVTSLSLSLSFSHHLSCRVPCVFASLFRISLLDCFRHYVWEFEFVSILNTFFCKLSSSPRFIGLIRFRLTNFGFILRIRR